MNLTKTEKKVESMIDLIVQIRDAFGSFHLENMANYLNKNFVDLETYNEILIANGLLTEEMKKLRHENASIKMQMKKLMGG